MKLKAFIQQIQTARKRGQRTVVVQTDAAVLLADELELLLLEYVELKRKVDNPEVTPEVTPEVKLDGGGFG